MVSTVAFTEWLAAPSMPWFVLGFIAVVILNSVGTIPVGPDGLDRPWHDLTCSPWR